MLAKKKERRGAEAGGYLKKTQRASNGSAKEPRDDNP